MPFEKMNANPIAQEQDRSDRCKYQNGGSGIEFAQGLYVSRSSEDD
jgi:hypothetical protein